MNLQVWDINGNVVKEVSLNQDIWGIEPHEQAMFDAVIAQRASWRQGTHKTKTRGEVRGGGRKPWKQKGTGRARQGSIRSPQWKGGGTVFGPTTEKNYKLHVNRKVRKLALKSLLSLKAKENNVLIIEGLSFEIPSTKKALEIFKNLKLVDQKKLLILQNINEGTNDFVLELKTENEKIAKSVNNIENINVITSNGLNPYDLMNAEKLVITLEAFENIQEVFA